MAADVSPGPERESAQLERWETDLFAMIVAFHTHSFERQQVSNAFRTVRCPQSIYVIDGFHRSVRKMWRTAPGC